MEETIDINLWDDFNDGDETFMFIESPELNEKEEKNILVAISLLINDYFNPRLDFKSGPLFSRWEIKLTIKHEEIERLLVMLGNIGFNYNGKKFRYYSES